MGKFWCYKDSAGEWRWRFKAPNGRVQADSAEGYKTRQNVDRAIRAFCHNAGIEVTHIKYED